MAKKLIGVAIATMIVAVVFPVAARGQVKATSNVKGADSGTSAKQTPSVAKESGNPAIGRGLAAIDRAGKENRYLFIFFFKVDDDRTRTMKGVLQTAMQKVADKADFILIDTTDPLEKGIVDKFKVALAPMPFVFSIAPNGAIIHSFRLAFSEEQLLSAFASPSMEKCLKALQDSKYVMLCVQNEKTRLNGEAMKGVRDFVADAQYAQSTDVVTVDPSDAKEADFLTKFGVNTGTPEAVTVLLAPPGKIMGTFKGATDKNALVAAITKGKSGGCCPGASGKSTCGK